MLVTLCFALHLYSGPVEAGTPVTELSWSCSQATEKTVQRTIRACNRQGVERCEAIIGKDGATTIELKIQDR